MSIESKAREIVDKITSQPIRVLQFGFGASLALLAACSSVSATDTQHAIYLAQQLYQTQKAQGVDFSSGPCLSGEGLLMPDWVADTVHVPRIQADDLSQNECSPYLKRVAHHFVELNLATGDVVQVH